MKSLRSIRLRAHLLPLVLFALALRVLLPADAMAGAGMSVTSSMCSVSASRSEVVSIPGEEPARQHCEQCFAPPMAGPSELPQIAGLVRAVLPQPRALGSQIPEQPLARAQSARAPPQG
ncbi:MAG: hypothetical protein ABI769_19760 [Pseudomonadota bacterium]